MNTINSAEFESPFFTRPNPNHEEIVVDERDNYTTVEKIQHKLQRILPNNTIPVSSMHGMRMVRR